MPVLALLLAGIQDGVVSEVRKRSRTFVLAEAQAIYVPSNDFYPSTAPGSRVTPPPSKSLPPQSQAPKEAPSPNKSPKKKPTRFLLDEAEEPTEPVSHNAEVLDKVSAAVRAEMGIERVTSLAGSSKRVGLGRPPSLTVKGAAAQATTKEVSRLESRGATLKADELLKETRSEGNVSSHKNLVKKAKKRVKLLFGARRRCARPQRC